VAGIKIKGIYFLNCLFTCNRVITIRMYQVGEKTDEVGYGVYDICKQNGKFYD
jgi:hypothetical protein